MQPATAISYRRNVPWPTWQTASSLLLLVVAALLAACEQQPEEVYRPTILTGTAYVLADADHIAVLDLESQKLSRIVVDRPAVDIAGTEDGLYILSTDGALARLPYGQTDIKEWRHAVSSGVSLAVDGQKRLWILGPDQLCRMDADQPVCTPVAQGATALFAGPDRLWLLHGKQSTAVPIDLQTLTPGRELTAIGNSIHQGLAAADGREILIAEGNEYLAGKPYGVGFATKGPAMPGGINVIDTTTGKMTDFVMLRGNAVDLAFSPDGGKILVICNRTPEFQEASLAVLEAQSRRTRVEFRLCYACHEEQGVEIENGSALVKALAVRMP